VEEKMSIEVMRQALEALDHEANKGNDNAYQRERDALRTAIAEAEKQEPRCAVIVEVFGKDWRLDYMSLPVGKHRLYTQNYVYTTPPAAQQGMTIDASAPIVMTPHPAFAHRSAAQRQPLTDDRIGQIIEQCKITLVNYCSGEKQTDFARAIEAAHGIGEKK
jgi:hypothetical protein